MSDDLRERFALWEEIRDAIRAEIKAWGYTAQECPLESLSADLASAVMNTSAVGRLRGARGLDAAETLHQIRSITNEYRNGVYWSSVGMERIAALLDEAP